MRMTNWLGELKSSYLSRQARPLNRRNNTRQRLLVNKLRIEFLEDRTLPTGRWVPTGDMLGTYANLFNPLAALLNDGRVLVSGSVTSPTQLYDPVSGTWSPSGTLNQGHQFGTLTGLLDGRVLIAGGDFTLPTAELYDPATGSWRFTGNMTRNRVGHTAKLLDDGRVLVVGGYPSENTSELYDPATENWSLTGNTVYRHGGGHVATLLRDGRVLVAGGFTGCFEAPCYRRAELYDSATGSWRRTGDMIYGGTSGFTLTTLPDGTVLATGGSPAGAEIYDPKTETWRAAGTTHSHHSSGAATLLQDGTVLIAGGAVGGPGCEDWDQDNSADLYDPGIGQWIELPNMGIGRSYFTLTALPDGTALAAGGVSHITCDPLWGFPVPVDTTRAELYVPDDASGHPHAAGHGKLSSAKPADSEAPGTLFLLVNGSLVVDVAALSLACSRWSGPPSQALEAPSTPEMPMPLASQRLDCFFASQPSENRRLTLFTTKPQAAAWTDDDYPSGCMISASEMRNISCLLN